MTLIKHPYHYLTPIVKELRAEREAQKVSQYAMSILVGHHVGQINRWETGRTQPSIMAVTNYAQSLGKRIILADICEKEEELPLFAHMEE